jgi:Leu/Phe-tRNA-protein transferase
MAYPIRFLPSGHVLIDPKDNCDRVVDALLKIGYNEEFCIAADFSEEFVGALMEAGFLVMSAGLVDEQQEEPFYILLPKLHLVRSLLFYPELHIKKSIRPQLSRYELRVDTDFDLVLDKCVQTHGEDWLTPPLVEVLRSIQQRKDMRVKPVSFAVYREGELKAGEIGVVAGRVYTSYSGYREENNAGTVQMILMAQWLEKAGFDFLDFGMPLEYNTQLGAHDVLPSRFVELFRKARK